MKPGIPLRATVLLSSLLLLSAQATAAGPNSPSSKGSKNSRTSQQLKVPPRSIGALKASYNGRYDAPNRSLDAQRQRRAERLSRPERVTRRNARNELMEHAESTTSSSGTRPLASPVNEPQLRPGRPKARVSIDGLKEGMSVEATRPRRLELVSHHPSDSSISNWTGGSSLTLTTRSSSSSSIGDFRRQASLDSMGRPTRRFSFSTQSSLSSVESDGVDALEGEGTRPASVELNRIRRDGRWYNQYRIGNAPEVLDGERSPAEDGS